MMRDIDRLQGPTAPSDPLGAELSGPASQWTAGCSPLHFVSFPVLRSCRVEAPQHQDSELRGGAAPEHLKVLSNPYRLPPLFVLHTASAHTHSIFPSHGIRVSLPAASLQLQCRSLDHPTKCTSLVQGHAGFPYCLLPQARGH